MAPHARRRDLVVRDDREARIGDRSPDFGESLEQERAALSTLEGPGDEQDRRLLGSGTAREEGGGVEPARNTPPDEWKVAAGPLGDRHAVPVPGPGPLQGVVAELREAA